MILSHLVASRIAVDTKTDTWAKPLRKEEYARSADVKIQHPTRASIESLVLFLVLLWRLREIVCQ